jgi:hypothetical protein
MKKDNNQFYIDFLNRNKNYSRDRKYFDTYEDAKKWALENFDRFDQDMINVIL